MNWRNRFVLALGVLALTPLLGGTHSSLARSDTSPLTATAICNDASGSIAASVEVTLSNTTTQPIVISYVRGFTTAQASNPRFAMVESDAFDPITVTAGEQATITAPWDDLRDGPGQLGAAIVFTNLGLLMPGCDDREVGVVTTPHSADISEEMSDVTYAAIALEAYGVLQTWRAYPAMYAMLHPDSQAAVSWGKFACANAKEHGTAADPFGTIFSTEVATVQMRDFDYSVTGQHYDEAVQINFRQTVGSIAKTNQVGNTTFLVMVDGQYRPFYGNDPNLIATFPETCDLLDA